MAGPVEADPEYQLIVEANNITVEIDNEISEALFLSSALKIFTLADMVWHLNVYLCFYRCDSQVYKRSLLQEIPWTGITRSHTTRVH